MTLQTGPNLGLLIHGDLDDQHYLELMKQWRGLDALVFPVVRSVVSAPPVEPVNGDLHIVGSSATGVFTDKEQQLARFYDVGESAPGWEFYEPKVGWRVHLASVLVNGVPVERVFNGTNWVESPSSGVTQEQISYMDIAYNNIYSASGVTA